MKIGVVIPAKDEQETVASVVSETLLAASLLGSVRVVVADNASTDTTSEEARAAGAEVVFVEERGCGNACLGAADHLGDWPDDREVLRSRTGLKRWDTRYRIPDAG